MRFGYTERQARFLATVMLHGGVCVERRYCKFAGIAHGQKTHDFFERLVNRRHATLPRRALSTAGASTTCTARPCIAPSASRTTGIENR